MNILHIKKTVENFFAINLATKNRTLEYVEARATYYRLCQEFCPSDFRFTKVGRSVDRKHATVIHGIKTFESLYIYSGLFRKSYNDIKDILKAEIKDSKDIKKLSEVDEKLVNKFLLKKDETIGRLSKSNERYLSLINHYKRENRKLRSEIDKNKQSPIKCL